MTTECAAALRGAGTAVPSIGLILIKARPCRGMHAICCMGTDQLARNCNNTHGLITTITLLPCMCRGHQTSSPEPQHSGVKGSAHSAAQTGLWEASGRRAHAGSSACMLSSNTTSLLQPHSESSHSSLLDACAQRSTRTRL